MTVPARDGIDAIPGRTPLPGVSPAGGVVAGPATALAEKVCDAQQLTGDQQYRDRISCVRGSIGPPNHARPLILPDG